MPRAPSAPKASYGSPTPVRNASGSRSTMRIIAGK
jgi:hypothetical protein